MKTRNNPIKYILFALATLLGSLLNVYAVKALIIFGSPLLFFTALLAAIILFAIFIYSVTRLLFLTQNIVKSLALSVYKGLAENEYIKKYTTSKHPVIQWFNRRFNRRSAFGLPLSATVLLAIFFLVNFLNLLITIKSNVVMSHVDVRILNQIPNIRTPIQDNFFRIVTMLANAETAILLIITSAIIFWRKRQRLLAGFILLVAAGEESITYLIKHLVKRSRPDRVLSLFGEDSFSFPSGHAVRANVLFGFIAYIIFKSYVSFRARFITVATYILSVYMIALSRVYLGVHYPSDVWGGILLGGVVLTIIIGSMEIASHFKIFRHDKIVISNRGIVIVPMIIFIFAFISAPFFIRFKPVLATPAFITIQPIDENNVQKLPLYSETLTGNRMEPINFIYYAYEDQIINLFKSHSWEKADKSTLNNTLKAIAVGFQGRQYITAPVTPSFLNSKPENLAFEKSTEIHSLRQRHHTRIWRTDYALADGRQVWVATASFDDGIKFVGSAKLPTHHIDPNIDAERTFITKSLGVETKLLQIVKPQLGINAGGDGFFTDGKAEVIEL